MGDKETAENLCRWLEPMAEPAGVAGAFWRAAGPRGIKRGDAVTDIEAHKTAIVAALEEVRRSVTDAESLRQSIVSACDGTGCVNAHELRKALDAAKTNVEWLSAEWRRMRKSLNAIAWATVNPDQMVEIARDTLAIGCKVANERAESAASAKESSSG